MPPRGVKKGTKRARQYEHVKESAKDRGAPEGRAEEQGGTPIPERAPETFSGETTVEGVREEIEDKEQEQL